MRLVAVENTQDEKSPPLKKQRPEQNRALYRDNIHRKQKKVQKKFRNTASAG